jgi:hypothetical protein
MLAVSNEPPQSWENELTWEQTPEEDEFFDLGEDYESGERSGIEEDDKGEIIFRDKSLKPELSIGPNAISNPLRASDNNKKNRKIAK